MEHQDLLHDFGTAAPEKINPLETIWLEPRKTIRYLVWEDKIRIAYLVILSSLLLGGINSAALFNDRYGITVAALVLAGNMIVGFLLILFTAYLFQVTKGTFGGEATYKEVIHVSAWSSLPTIAAGVVGIFLLMAMLDDVIFLATLLGLIWRTVTFVIAMAEVQRYSVGKSILHTLMVSLVLLVVLVALGMGLALFSRLLVEF